MFAPTYYRPKGATNELVLYLSPHQHPPLSVPFELQSHVSADSWSYRIPAIIRSSSRYSKPRLELSWVLIGFMAIVAVPLALYQMAFGDIGRPTTSKDYALRQVQARGVSFGIFVGLLLFFLLPILAWKFMGRRQMNMMLRKWSDADRINSGHRDTIPPWRVEMPGIFRDKITLIITFLPKSPTSGFHPNAYIPSYINGPVDADANYYYPYKPEPGLPRMSTIGNVPLYLDEKRDFNDLKV